MGLHKLFAANYDRHIQQSRLAQGLSELESCSKEQQEEVTRAWMAICTSGDVSSHDESST